MYFVLLIVTRSPSGRNPRVISGGCSSRTWLAISRWHQQVVTLFRSSAVNQWRFGLVWLACCSPGALLPSSNYRSGGAWRHAVGMWHYRRRKLNIPYTGTVATAQGYRFTIITIISYQESLYHTNTVVVVIPYAVCVGTYLSIHC